jgi:hypothetical protein
VLHEVKGLSVMKSNRTGLALVELMIAISIAIVSFGAIFALAMQSMRVIRDVHGDTIATRAAESEIERLRALHWESFQSLGAGYALDATRVPALAELGGVKGAVRIAPQSAGASEMPRGVSVRIEWTGCNGKPREIALATIIGPKLHFSQEMQETRNPNIETRNKSESEMMK